MKSLVESERVLASDLYSLGWSPNEIANCILQNRARRDIVEMNREVTLFLMIGFKKQMYPIEVYGKLEDALKERQNGSNISRGR